MTSSVKAQDCEYFTPPVNLKSKARVKTQHEATTFDPVAAAEEALNNLSGNFGTWMAEETGTLVKIWTEISRTKLTPENREDLFRAAHDIKGQATTLGFPLASTIADSLCHLLETVQDTQKIPSRLIEQHVHSIRAIYAEDAREEKDPLARQLATQLVAFTDNFIANLKK